MANSSTPCPAGWSEVTDPDRIVGKYDPRPVTQFTREGGDVGVHALPAEPNRPHADTSEYRVGVSEGGRDDTAGGEPVARAPDFEAALAVAAAFMEAFEAADGDRIERAVAAAREAPPAEPP